MEKTRIALNIVRICSFLACALAVAPARGDDVLEGSLLNRLGPKAEKGDPLKDMKPPVFPICVNGSCRDSGNQCCGGAYCAPKCESIPQKKLDAAKELKKINERLRRQIADFDRQYKNTEKTPSEEVLDEYGDKMREITKDWDKQIKAWKEAGGEKISTPWDVADYDEYHQPRSSLSPQGKESLQARAAVSGLVPGCALYLCEAPRDASEPPSLACNCAEGDPSTRVSASERHRSGDSPVSRRASPGRPEDRLGGSGAGDFGSSATRAD